MRSVIHYTIYCAHVPRSEESFFCFNDPEISVKGIDFYLGGKHKCLRKRFHVHFQGRDLEWYDTVPDGNTIQVSCHHINALPKSPRAAQTNCVPKNTAHKAITLQRIASS